MVFNDVSRFLALTSEIENSSNYELWYSINDEKNQKIQGSLCTLDTSFSKFINRNRLVLGNVLDGTSEEKVVAAIDDDIPVISLRDLRDTINLYNRPIIELIFKIKDTLYDKITGIRIEVGYTNISNYCNNSESAEVKYRVIFDLEK